MGSKSKHKNKNTNQNVSANDTIQNLNDNDNKNTNNPQQNKFVHMDVQMLPNTVLVDVNEYGSLQKENIELKTKIFELFNHKMDLLNIIMQRDKTIDELKLENETLKKILDELREQNKNFKEEIKDLKKEIKDLVDKNEKFEALSKLIDCDRLANNAFKSEYRKYFGLNKYCKVPNLGQFVLDPPEKSIDKDNYDFWTFFCQKYPNSDNKEFQLIYKQVNEDRVKNGAHYDVHIIDKIEFDNLMMKALPDIYNNNRKLCDDYKNWLYLF